MKFYQCNIQDLSNESYIHYYSLMSEEKKRRVDRFRFEDDKKRTVVGEMLARQGISKWRGVPEESIVFEITEHGKPYVKGLNVEFNISHSADMVICVVDDNPVGVDIEKIRIVDNKTIMYICNEKDLYYIFGSKNEKNSSTTLNNKNICNFFEIWTSKEAICKFESGGLCKDLKSISIGQYLLHTEYIEDGEYVLTICLGKKQQK